MDDPKSGLIIGTRGDRPRDVCLIFGVLFSPSHEI